MGLAFSGELRREGDVSDSANVCGAGPLGDRSLPKRAFGRHWEAYDSLYGTIQLGGTGRRDGFFRKTRREEARAD